MRIFFVGHLIFYRKALITLLPKTNIQQAITKIKMKKLIRKIKKVNPAILSTGYLQNNQPHKKMTHIFFVQHKIHYKKGPVTL